MPFVPTTKSKYYVIENIFLVQTNTHPGVGKGFSKNMLNARSPLYCALILVFSFVGVSAQNSTGSIIGQVTERTTGRPIAGVRVYVKDRAETKTDSDGNFRLDIASGIYDVRVDDKGFAPVIKNQVGVTGGRNTLLAIALDVTISEKVEVRSEVFAENNEQPVSNLTLDREALRTTPGSGGDILRALSSQPGVTAASAEFGDLIVRGGTPEENLTFIDNIPVGDFTYFTEKYDGNHGGRAAILAPDTIEKAEFSTGGVGARYGDRLSSALDITLREANRKRVQGVIFADSGTAGGSIDVPLGKRGSWLSSARRSYVDVALAVAGIATLDVIGYPRTLDFTNKIVYDLTPRHRLSVTAMNFLETFNQTDTQASHIDRRTDRFRMRRTSQRDIYGATLSSTISAKTLAQTTAWLTISHNDGSFFLPFTTTRQRQRDLRDSELGVKEDIGSSPSRKIQLSAGGGIYVDQANYYVFENAGKPYSPLEEEYYAPARENRLKLGSTTSAYAYLQAVFQIAPRFSVTPGIRVDHYGVTGETKVSPRIGARFRVAPKVSLTFAAGYYRQPPSLFILSLTAANRGLKTQTAIHIVGGLEWLVREDTRIRVEAYQKNYDDLIVQPLHPTPAFVKNGNYFNSGAGSVQGLDISVQKAVTGFFTGEASYGFTRSRRRFSSNGVEFPSDYDRPHQLTLIGATRFYGFTVAAKFRVASGLPYVARTQVLAVPNTGVFLQRIVTDASINSLRLPTFASLDVRAGRRFGFKHWSLSPYIDIFNITNHRTAVDVNYEFSRRAGQIFHEDQRFPIFGLRVEF